MPDAPATVRVVPEFGPLSRVTVLDSARFVAGPWASTYLGEFGAQVIHVEGPPFDYPYADPTRTLPPVLPEGAPPEEAVSESWIQYSRNKLSVGLDIRTPSGRAVFLDLARQADIWVESSRPGTYDRLGLTDAALWEANRRLTIVHVSGYGRTGDPDRLNRPSYDLIGQAYSGYLSLQGQPDPEPPMRAGTALNDTVTGLATATASLMGYIDAQRTGVGQAVDVAQYEVFFTLLENLALDFFTRGVVRGRFGTAHARLHPYDVHRAQDGWVVVAAPTLESLRGLQRLLGVENSSWLDYAWRMEHRAEVDAAIAAYCRDRTCEELETVGRTSDVAISKVYDARAIAGDRHYAERGMFLEWEDPVAGPVKGAGVAPKFGGTPGGVWRGAPWLGQDNERVLVDILGYSRERCHSLYAEGTLGARPPKLDRSQYPAAEYRRHGR
ncbi:MAG: CoA transferase [Thermoplasmata archaeon]|nr:CoA transferase [Thermoplasmata archaeon]